MLIFNPLLYKNNIYGRLKVLKVYRKDNCTWAKCRCRCKNKSIVIIRLNSLRSGVTGSCGCWRQIVSINNGKINGKLSKGRVRKYKDKKEIYSIEYKIWTHIKDRLFNSKCKAWKNYGGRGIKMLYAWAKSFKRFIRRIVKNIGRRPGSKYSIDRIDNNKGYFPGNLKWSTKKEQSNNQRRNNQFKGTIVNASKC